MEHCSNELDQMESEQERFRLHRNGTQGIRWELNGSSWNGSEQLVTDGIGSERLGLDGIGTGPFGRERIRSDRNGAHPNS